MACGGGRGLRLRDHPRGQKHSLHVLRRLPGDSVVEVCLDRRPIDRSQLKPKKNKQFCVCFKLEIYCQLNLLFETIQGIFFICSSFFLFIFIL